MSVDGDPNRDGPIDPQCYETRRKMAAEFWRGIPPGAFNMTQWGSGTGGCALSWLASKEVDGWTFAPAEEAGRYGVPSLATGLKAYMAAAFYFGLTIQEAQQVFGPGRQTAGLHRRWFPRRISSDDVGRTLICMPYTAQPDRHCLR